MKEILTENYCDDCDEVLYAVFDEDAFNNHKVGAIQCKCGCIVMPCNECNWVDINGNHTECETCPWKNADVTKAMSDEAYVRWCKANEPKIYEIMKGNTNGDYYHEIIKKIESEN